MTKPLSLISALLVEPIVVHFIISLLNLIIVKQCLNLIYHLRYEYES